MNSVLCSLLCIYALLKFLFGFTGDNNFLQNGNFKRFWLRFIFISLTLLTSLLTACLLLIFYLLHNLVDTYLRIKLCLLYGGMLKRQDAGLRSLRKRIMERLVFILNENEDVQDIWTPCLEKARNLHASSYKLSSTIRNCFGYCYYLKDQIKFEEVVKEGRIGNAEFITKDAFVDYVNALHYAEDDERLWTFEYFPQPILWNNNSTKQYAIIISLQHCLTDGPNLMKHLMKYFLDVNYAQPQTSSLPSSKNAPKFSIDDAYIRQNPFYTRQHTFPRVNKYAKEQFLAIFSEDTEKYLGLIKKVKTKLGVGFTSVLVSALSGSLADHLKKKKLPQTDEAMCALIRPEAINLVFKSNGEDELINDIGQLTINIPAQKQADSSACERTRTINENIYQEVRSLDITLWYMGTKISHLFPSVVQRMLCERVSQGITSAITNVSGMTNLFIAGHRVQAGFFFPSDIPGVAFTFCVTSVDGCLQLSLLSSGLYVSTRDELQDVLLGTLGYVDQLAKDLQIA